LASASADGTIKIWMKNGDRSANAKGDRLLEKPLYTLEGHNSEVFGVAISPDSQYIVSTGGDGNLRLWRRNGTLARVFPGDNIGFTRVAFSPFGYAQGEPDGEIVAAASFDNTIKVKSGCDWVQDYLSTNTKIEKSDRDLCRH